jgi:hypothetical protein
VIRTERRLIARAGKNRRRRGCIVVVIGGQVQQVPFCLMLTNVLDYKTVTVAGQHRC